MNIFAKWRNIGYYVSVTQQKNTIEDIKKLITKEYTGEAFYRSEFHTILDDMKMALDRQDSDSALNTLIQWAITLKASDVHLEIQEYDSVPRFRIDGNLAPLWKLSMKEHETLVERLKYRSNLKLNIHNVPQDGKFRLGKDGKEAKIDIRVSVMPTRYGESVVCRILDATNNVLTIDALGIIGTQKTDILHSLEKKQGMILVTGPTGSGKTTTLYTLIDMLKNPEDKIITLEDPIEYQIPDVLQSEINEREGYTFASGVRSVLRHDPDIIMIGEIRDLDTANTAIQAALTGHLVLSTLHTKSAIETVDRLVNMWVSNYDIAASVDIIIAQRLVRRVCHHCGVSDENAEIRPEDIELLKRYGSEKAFIQHWVGCEECGYTGFSGRVGIYEVFAVTDAIRDSIRSGHTDTEMFQLARKDGFLTLADDARAKVLLWMTTTAECEGNGLL